ncbi:hypothetical protein [Ruegeria atlantica]|uniref:Uncharacterized protein n=1 Tax=Ruegeria atlantica TaxID=81569 RepID=A0A0P1ED73_9RHOB|nr:hypothetical protein [Ruegeria atlantica]CUH47503.1 hypothetical protein RUA4292_01674 [Ruegeria atlantica]
MKRSKLPPIQARRFDVEMLQDTAFSLTEHASKGPTWLRHKGRISFVVLTEELFEQIWPDHRRAWSVDDMPIRHEQMLLEALEASLSQDNKE